MFDVLFPVAQGLVALCVLVVFGSIGLTFAQTSKRAVKMEARTHVATLSMTVFFVLMYVCIRFHLGEYPVPDPRVRTLSLLVGLACIILGTIVHLWGRVNLGDNWSSQIKIYEGHALVRHGAYALVRHPLYASLAVMFFGAAIMYRNLLVLLADAVLFFPAVYSRAVQEEKIFTREFPAYATYRQSVGMFFPKLTRCSRAAGSVTVNRYALTFCRSTTAILLVLAIIFKIKFLVVCVFLLMLWGALFTIQYAPFFVLYHVFLRRFFKQPQATVDIAAVRFAQGFGAALLLIALAYLYVIPSKNAGWIFSAIVAISTAFGAAGYCVGAQIYFALKKILRHG
ncbi:MAG: DUF4395 family protein [Patescibacteria group bacterium]|nr:DUF4395 family protein [Patescibacteria group bacterium]